MLPLGLNSLDRGSAGAGFFVQNVDEAFAVVVFVRAAGDVTGKSLVMRNFALALGNSVQVRLLLGDEKIWIESAAEFVTFQVEATPLATFDPFALAANQGARSAIKLVHGVTAGRITACIPSKKNRKVQIQHDPVLYRQRHKIENMFGKLKDWRRIHTRYDCLIPDFDGASLILSRQDEDALWEVFFMAAPVRRRVFEPNSKRRKKAPGPLPPATV